MSPKVPSLAYFPGSSDICICAYSNILPASSCGYTEYLSKSPSSVLEGVSWPLCLFPWYFKAKTFGVLKVRERG